MYISHAGLVLGMLSYFVAELLFERLYVRVLLSYSTFEIKSPVTLLRTLLVD